MTAKFLFHLTDENENQSLSQDEITAFFNDFIDLFAQLSLNCLGIQRADLVQRGERPITVDRQIQDIQATLEDATLLILSQLSTTLFSLDTNKEIDQCLLWSMLNINWCLSVNVMLPSSQC